MTALKQDGTALIPASLVNVLNRKGAFSCLRVSKFFRLSIHADSTSFLYECIQTQTNTAGYSIHKKVPIYWIIA